ncbi:MAG TPA: phospho-N-acetylmuramoyl-pentapeptide-transferase [Microbacteriaceae bacterium]|nr:phospho-N-acetylmuramoyl-pentapeptide-transferase [Microbacteriaceae bacterium]
MRSIIAAGVVAFVFTIFLTPVFIRLFIRLGWGQFIRDDGPQSHHTKRGTPTMGGIIFILGSTVGYFAATLVSGDPPTVSALLVLGMMAGLGVVGFIDDYLKTHRKQSLGLGGWAKVFGQLVIATLFAAAALNFPSDQGITPASTHISLIRDLPLDFLALGPVLGVGLYVLWIALITTAASNGVNVTDGLDGLATGSTLFAIGAYIIIGFWQFNQWCFGDRAGLDLGRCYVVRDPLDLAIVATAISGALLGFLWWNTNPAKIYMGDTGSLALGGALAALAVLSRTELLLVLVGGLFVIEAGSVIVQRAYFKLTHGKRIFRMSPIHHHFELKGWEEVTVVVRFWIIAAMFVAAGVGIFYLEWLQS